MVRKGERTGKRSLAFGLKFRDLQEAKRFFMIDIDAFIFDNKRKLIMVIDIKEVSTADFIKKKRPKLGYFQQRTYWELSQKFNVPSYIVVVEDKATWIENYHENDEYRKKLVDPKYRIYKIMGPTIGAIKELLEFNQMGFEVWLEKHV